MGTCIDLTGKVVVVTGGNGGIGLGLAKGVAEAGARVVIMGRNQQKISSALETISEVGVGAVGLEVDVSDEESIVTGFRAAREAFGRVDALFANAGVSSGRVNLVDTKVDIWNSVLQTNLIGAVLCMREAAKIMIDQGDGGSLVAVSSVSAIHGAAGNIPYAASKTALLGVVRALAVELARYRIRVNSLLPGWIETEMTAPLQGHEKFMSATLARTPARRWGTPDDFKSVGAFLADPHCIYHTGDTMVVDGAYSIF